MKIEDISPIFLANTQHKVFAYALYHNVEKKIKVVKLKCIDPTPQLNKGDIYWGYKDTANASRYYYEEYPIYKIFLPILGARKYSTDRFIVLDCMELSSKDFNKNTFKQLKLKF